MDTAILNGLDAGGELDELAGRGFRVGEGTFGGELHRYPITGTTGLFQLKSGRTSAPRPPQPRQMKRGSRSDSRGRPASDPRSAQRGAAMAVNQDAAQAHLAHLAEGDLHLPAVGVRRRVALGARHVAIEAPCRRESNYQSLGPGKRSEALWVVGVGERSAPVHAGGPPARACDAHCVKWFTSDRYDRA
jgi:hypothetical protein